MGDPSGVDVAEAGVTVFGSTSGRAVVENGERVAIASPIRRRKYFES